MQLSDYIAILTASRQPASPDPVEVFKHGRYNRHRWVDEANAAINGYRETQFFALSEAKAGLSSAKNWLYDAKAKVLITDLWPGAHGQTLADLYKHYSPAGRARFHSDGFIEESMGCFLTSCRDHDPVKGENFFMDSQEKMLFRGTVFYIQTTQGS